MIHISDKSVSNRTETSLELVTSLVFENDMDLNFEISIIRINLKILFLNLFKDSLFF